MDRISTISLIGANAALAATILLSEWGYYQALVVFWLEILIVGLYNIARIYVVALFGDPFGRWVGFESKLSAFVGVSCAVGFFVVKFGGFVIGSGIAILALPPMLADDGADGAVVALGALEASLPGIAACAGALFISHGISFAVNFVWRREYQHAQVLQLLFSPYLRLLYLVVTLLLALVVAHVQPVVSTGMGFALTLVAIKVGGDLANHLWMHRRLARRRSGFTTVTSPQFAAQ